jgi:hypothetical protein
METVLIVVGCAWVIAWFDLLVSLTSAARREIPDGEV